MENPYERFVDQAQQTGVAVSSTTDGYFLLFRRDHLQKMLLTTLTPMITIDIKAEGKTHSIQLSHNKLQTELEATTESLIAVVYFHDSVKN
jgi:hypothetical protein